MLHLWIQESQKGHIEQRRLIGAAICFLYHFVPCLQSLDVECQDIANDYLCQDIADTLQFYRRL